jgi:hypothetical protein
MRPCGCTKAIALGLFLLAASVGTVLGQANDPFIGTWKLNLAKSTFDAARPAPQSKTLTFEDRGGVFLVLSETTDTQGRLTSARAAFKRDGKDYPVAAKAQQTDMTLAYKAVDAHLVEVIIKIDGKTIATGTESVSRDGKTFTFSATGTTRQGQSTTSVEVYDRQ